MPTPSYAPLDYPLTDSYRGDNGVDNQKLLAINEAIASHPVEAGRARLVLFAIRFRVQSVKLQPSFLRSDLVEACRNDGLQQAWSFCPDTDTFL